jgi:hypothetical protein
MKSLDIFLGHSLAEVEQRLVEKLMIDEIPTLDMNEPFLWDLLLRYTFNVIPDDFFPLIDIFVSNSAEARTLRIDRDYIFQICWRDVISTTRFYFKNKHEEHNRSFLSLKQLTNDDESQDHPYNGWPALAL